MSPVPLKKVSATELRSLFNDQRYAQKAANGELSVKIIREGHPSPARSGEPPCTKSQILAYLNAKGQSVAILHQYLRKDGTIGASGKPDPKKVFHDGVLHVLP